MSEYRFLESHEWAKKEGDLIVCGISDYAQKELGDIVFVEVPEEDSVYDKGDSFCSIESVKAASDIYMPVAGIIVEVNDELEDNPALINDDAEGEGWICKIKPENDTDFEEMLTEAEYKALIAKD